MSKYNETTRVILSEVEKFMLEGVKNVSLSKSASKQRQSILDKIDALREEYPNVLPPKPAGTSRDGMNSTSTDNDDSVNTGSSHGSADDTTEDNPYSENIPHISASDAALGCLRSGTLSKRRKAGDLRSKLTPYQKRLCIIKKNTFYYYEKSTDKQQKGAFSLAGYEFRDAPFLVKETNRKDVSFQLIKPGDRTYEFLAASKQDMLEWRKAVEKAAVEKPTNVSTEPQSIQEDFDDEIYEPIDEHDDLPPTHSRPTLPSRNDDVQRRHPVPEEPSEIYDDADLAPTTRASSIYDDATSGAKFTTPTKTQLSKTLPGLKDCKAIPDEPKTKECYVPNHKAWKIGVSDDYGNMYYSKWNCTAEADNELEFKKGDMIHVLSKEFDTQAWWVGELEGKIGLVPKQYLVEAYERMID